jgi:peptide/nickel transport system permease protein
MKNKTLSIGLFIVLAFALVAVFAPVLAPEGPYAQNVRSRLRPPSPVNIFGTDNFGRDLFSRVVWGTRISLLVGLGSVAFTLVFGLVFGLLAGYFQRLDGPIMRAMDGLMAFPPTLLAMAMMAIVEPGLQNIILALSIVHTPRCARVVRGQVLSLRGLEYVDAVRALGASDVRIMVRHILPNCLSPLLVQESFVFAQAIMTEATLSFLGIGLPPPTPSWGAILNEGQHYMMDATWFVVFPALAFMLCIIGVNLLGDGLRDYLDPQVN